MRKLIFSNLVPRGTDSDFAQCKIGARFRISELLRLDLGLVHHLTYRN
jgi:hypothetical protein